MIEEKRYILFDLETRNILGINRSKPALSETYFEVDYKDVEEFIENKKNPVHYYIDKDVKQSKYSIKLKKTDIAIKLIDDRLFKICHIIGLLPILTIGFGIFLVILPSLLPFPPAKIIACIIFVLIIYYNI